jgi:hypothetical protein
VADRDFGEVIVWSREAETRFDVCDDAYTAARIDCPDVAHTVPFIFGGGESATPIGDFVAWTAEHWHCYRNSVRAFRIDRALESIEAGEDARDGGA